MFLSVSTHIFVYHEFREEFIDIIEDSGIRAVEVFAVNPHFPYRNIRFVDRMVNRFEKKNIRIHSVHFPLYFHIENIKKRKWISLSTEHKESRLAAVDETVAASKVISSASGGTLVVHTSIPGGELRGKRIFLFMDSMKRLLDELPDNVKIAIENTTNSCGSASITMGLAESFPEERVGTCIDIGHAHVIESPSYALVTAKRRLLNIHCSDNLGKEDEHLPPGDGSVNWKHVVATLKGVKYRGPLTLEIRDPSRGAENDPGQYQQLISKSADYLHGLVWGGGE